MGARGDRAHRLPVRDRAARGRRGAQRRHRPPRRVRQPRGASRRPRARSSRRCRRRRRRCSTPTTRWSPRWPAAPAARVLTLRRGPAAVRALGDYGLDDLGRPALPARRTRRRGAAVRLRPGRRAPGRQRRRRRRHGGRRRRPAAPTRGRGAARAPPACPAWRMEVHERADGAGRRQRRLQRQPRLDARRARGAGRDRPSRPGRPHGRRARRDAGARRRRRGEHGAVGQTGRARRASTCSLVVGAGGRGRWPTVRASAAEGAGEAMPVAEAATQALAWLRENVAARRRRPGQGVPRCSALEQRRRRAAAVRDRGRQRDESDPARRRAGAADLPARHPRARSTLLTS